MAESSKIEWTDHTFNPWEGCQKVGPGCDHCYAEARNARFAGGTAINWGPGAPRRRTSAANWKKPLKWNAEHDTFFAQHGRRQRVFCASLADVFDNAVSTQWRFELLKLIEQTPNLDWLLLTKRIGNATEMLEQAVRAINHGRWGWRDNVFPNVWIGATVVNQEEADRDIPKLLAVPARVRFLSMEPLLGPIRLDLLCAPADRVMLNGLTGKGGTGAVSDFNFERGIDWVIVGGESGAGARPMHPDWARNLRGQCQAASVPFLFKQWGEWAPPTKRDDLRLLGDQMRSGKAIHVYGDGREPDGHFRKGDDHLLHVGKKAAGRLLDGREWNEFPEVAR